MKYLKKTIKSVYGGVNRVGNKIKKTVGSAFDKIEARAKADQDRKKAENIQRINKNYPGGVEKYVADQEADIAKRKARKILK